MELTRTACEYALEFDFPMMLAIIKADESAPKALSDLLDEIPGVDRTNYSGHTGAAVYFRVESESDTAATHQSVVHAIQCHIGKPFF